MQIKQKSARRKLPETLEKTLSVRLTNNTIKFLEYRYNQAPLKYRSYSAIVREAVEIYIQKEIAKLGGELWI
jgi:hypothetical protein